MERTPEELAELIENDLEMAISRLQKGMNDPKHRADWLKMVDTRITFAVDRLRQLESLEQA